MSKNIVHLIKLSVGTENVEQLVEWQRHRSQQVVNGQYYHQTRMWPKREAEILNGGSIYWVIKGEISARQRIIRLDEKIGADGIRRCGIVLDSEVIPTVSALKRPFQGWRYLKPEDAPADLPRGRGKEDVLPVELNRALAEIGVL
ncbi:DUF1489 domain-containing protein [Sulfitobacter sp. F26169L]|uniref:DUF1489 family protein n=1 Tax=Sulfitobacter sp. F26169L TaxID=2996015 RepID=UPI002260AF1B|nr:DUF1489 domain-containing protein [Sulfitobacter sp. F26169L]MCX7567333.1 DUF1489 domain-containing protein [Sulfitobacter sp. F26169L]